MTLVSRSMCDLKLGQNICLNWHKSRNSYKLLPSYMKLLPPFKYSIISFGSSKLSSLMWTCYSWWLKAICFSLSLSKMVSLMKKMLRWFELLVVRKWTLVDLDF